MKNIKRRDLIQFLGLSSLYSCLNKNSETILDAILNSVLGNAYANQNGTKLRNGLILMQNGGPANWMTYGNLAPNGPNDLKMLKPNWQVATNISSISPNTNDIPQIDLEYSVYPIEYFGRQIFWPHVFTTQVAQSNGQIRGLEELTKHMVVVRGIEMQSNDHSGRRYIYSPDGIEPVFMSSALTQSTGQIPYITIGQDHMSGLQSAENRSHIHIDRDYFSEIFKSFQSNQNYQYLNNTKLNNRINHAINVLSKQRSGSTVDPQLQNLNRATYIIKQGLEVLENEYQQMAEKYDSLINRTIQSIPGVGLNDRPIPGLNHFPLAVDGIDKKFSSQNAEETQPLTNMFKLENFVMGNSDIREIFSSSSIPGLAKQFAISELLFKKNFTSLININISELSNLNLKNTSHVDQISSYNQSDQTIFNKTNSLSSKQLEKQSFDAHETGALGLLLGQTLHFRAMGSCLLEFQDTLKSINVEANRNLWQETAVMLTSEFNRKPHIGGSEHNHQGHSVAFLSGDLQMNVLGNIGQQALDQDPNYPGTYGDGVHNTQLNGRIKNSHIAKTFLTLLRGKSKSLDNYASLIEFNEQNNQNVAILPTGKTKIIG